MLLDSTDFNTPPLLPLSDSGSRGNAPKRLTCPIPIDQGNTNYCLPFACIYGAFAIEKYKNKKWTPQQISDSAYSATYILHKMRSKTDVSKNVTIANLRASLKEDGFCRAENYSNSINVNILPSWQADQEAKALRQKYKADTLVKIYMENDNYKITEDMLIDRFKTYLNANKPIILGARVETDFRAKYVGKGWWQPGEVEEPHALVVVGYNENNKFFELMNSYGRQWGEDGFIKLAYKNLMKIAGYAYVLNGKQGERGNDNGDKAELVETIDSTQQDLIAHFELKHKINNMQGGIEYYKRVVSYDTARKIYETNDDYDVNSTFKLVASAIPNSKKTYIFSLDAANNVQMYQQSDTIDFDVKREGNHEIIVLIADNEIADFSTRLEAFKTAKGQANGRLRASFGSILTLEAEITCMQGDDIDVKARRFFTANRSVVPIILSIKVK